MSQILLEGAHNVRDVAGLPGSGGLTRPRVLLRAAALDELTAADVERLVRDIGLNHVVDLRSATERAERGRGLLGRSSVRYSDLDVINDRDLVRRHGVREAAYSAGVDPAVFTADGYAEMLQLGAPAFVTALERLVEPNGTPAMIHCSLGKDRTGVLVALLLDVADVDRAAIVADYALSQPTVGRLRQRLAESQAFRDLAQRIPAFVFEPKPETMRLFLERLDGEWGGASGYFLANGIDGQVLERWRSLLVGD